MNEEHAYEETRTQKEIATEAIRKILTLGIEDDLDEILSDIKWEIEGGD